MIPPPPIPWILLPTKRSMKSLAKAQISAPAEKKRRERRSSCCLPKMSDKAAMKGWKTALVRR
jgi:hypothetical protein